MTKDEQYECIEWAIEYLKSRIWEVHKLNVGTYYQAILFLIEYGDELKNKWTRLQDLLCDWCAGL